jgi:hypothetical protein
MPVVSRMMAMAIGLVGSVIAFVIVALYSLVHLLIRVSGIPADRGHFFIGTGLSILAVIGSLFLVGSREIGAVILVLATIGFFFIIGWWAIIPAIFLLGAAGMAFMERREYRQPPTGIPQA